MAEAGRVQAETSAFVRAVAYAAADPFYGGQVVSTREKALMRLAIRAYTMPAETTAATARLQTEAAERRREAEAAETGPKCPYCSGPHTAGGCDIRPGGY